MKISTQLPAYYPNSVVRARVVGNWALANVGDSLSG